MTEPAWVIEARKNIGQKEAPGPAENPWIVGLWKIIKRGGIKTESVPWCAAFVGAMLEQVGIISSRFESARSYLTWGVPLKAPAIGAIVVLGCDGGGHVAFCVGQDNWGNLLLLGGNQGDAVNIAAFRADRVLGIRWPTAVPLPLPGPLPVGQAPASRSEA